MLFEHVKLMNAAYEVEEDMYLETESALIKYIGKTRPEGYAGECIDGRHKMLLPGFYNTHCHVPMTLLRGYGEGLPLDLWLTTKMFPFEAKLTPEDCYYGALLGIMEMLASGVVSFSDMYFDILDIAEAVRESGIKANISHGMSSSDEQLKIETLKGYRDTMALLKEVKGGDGRIRVDAGMHAEYTSTEALVRQVAELAKGEGLMVHTHISETKKEHEACKARHNGRTPVRFFADCGLLDRPVQSAHCIYIEPEDEVLLRESHSTMTHCISSNLKLGSGIARTRDLLSAGLNIVIGTDGAASNNNLNYMEEMHLAAMAAKGSTLDATALGVKDILRMATANGAAAQGRESCGVIAEGMHADLILFDLNKPHLVPDYDTLANIVYSAQASDICMTMVDGKIVYRDGVFTNIDKERVLYEAAARNRRIIAEL